MALRLQLVHLAWDGVADSTGYDILLDDAVVANAGARARTTKIVIPEGAEHKVSVRAKPSGSMQDARFEWGKVTAPPPPSPPPPPPPGTGALGLCLNASPSSAWLAKAATLNPTYVREDVISQQKVDWAAANGTAFIGCCNLANAGLTASMDKVNAWPQITVWELDNEPYFDGVYVPTWAQQALQLAQQIKAAHPGHKIVLPMFIQTNGGDYQTSGSWSPWANQVIDAAPGLKTITDYVSGHAYDEAVAPAKVFQTLDKVQGQLKAKGLDKPWHITECGWSAGTADSRQVSQAQQAQYTNDLIMGLRTRPWVQSIELYCLQTWGSGYYESFGLFNQDLSDRPVAQVYRNLNP